MIQIYFSDNAGKTMVQRPAGLMVPRTHLSSLPVATAYRTGPLLIQKLFAEMLLCALTQHPQSTRLGLGICSLI